MKISIIPLLVSMVVIGNLSCSKKSVAEEEGALQGQWTLAQIYDGYANGGGFHWSDIDPGGSQTLEFGEGGEYLENNGGLYGPSTCSGTYIILSPSQLEINSSCQTVTYQVKISELNAKRLIIDRQGFEGVVRYLYKRL